MAKAGKKTMNIRRAASYVGLGLAVVVPALVVAQIGSEFGPNESFVTGETLNADKLNRLVTSLRTAQNAGPGLGSVIAHMPNVTGAHSVAQMNQRGWAECDGTSTAEVSGAVIGQTPNLQGQFLRGVGAGGPSSSGAAQADATAVNGLSFAHHHLDRVADGPTYCNAGFGQSNTRLGGVQAAWTTPGSNPPVPAQSGCNYLTGPATTTGSDTAVPTSSDDETRPANIGVVWMMRVR
jgi:hypothetical protein